jgi:hypothetical protein
MKNFQKFFKKREDDTLDIQTLSTVSHAELSQLAIKLHAELKDAASIIETQEENLKQLKKICQSQAKKPCFTRLIAKSCKTSLKDFL